MAEYTRDYPTAPSAEEIKTGYAPSTINAAPFVKFLIWNFIGLAVTFVVAYGAVMGIDAFVQASDQAKYQRMMRQRPMAVEGPRLQPSKGHDTLDFEDMENSVAIWNKQQAGTSGFEEDPARPGHLKINEAGARRTMAAMNKQATSRPSAAAQ